MSKQICVLSMGCFDCGLVSKAAELSEQCGGNVHVLITDASEAEKAFFHGADQVSVIKNYETTVDDYLTAAWLKEKITTEWKPEVILAPATIRLRGILPILAGMLGAGLTADCTELQMEEGRLIQIRPAFGNNLMAWIKSTSEIQMATVRQGVFRSLKHQKEVKDVKEYILDGICRVEQVSYTPFENTCPLNQADIVLAGGMGIGSRQNFELLAEIAKNIGAGLGASRVAVDAGFAPYSCQVGQTGITVHPKLYIAVGISGAVQHLAGMTGSEKIVAINSDPRAPIFGFADYGIVGDWKEVLTKFVEKIS